MSDDDDVIFVVVNVDDDVALFRISSHNDFYSMPNVPDCKLVKRISMHNTDDWGHKVSYAITLAALVLTLS